MRVFQALPARAAVGAALVLLAAAPAPAAELCLVPSSGGVNVSRDCVDPFDWRPNGWMGFATEGVPCAEPPGTFPCLVVPSSYPYGWSISRSDTDPAETVGPLAGPVALLYLWLLCTDTDGFTAAEFALGGDLEVIGFQPANGFVNGGTPTEMRLAVGGCPAGPVVAGTIFVWNPAVGVDDGPEPSSWGTTKARHREAAP